jgi:uncharacterized membrane protein
MPSPDSERLEALSEAFVRLLKRVDQMEDRLARMEGPQRYAAPASAPAAAPVLPPRPPPLPPPLPPAMPHPVPPSLPHPTPEQQLETRMGLTWINRIGVITLIIGVAFFFKYAVDNQWIGETGRVVLGLLAGFAALAAGDILWRRGQKIFAQGICGLGVSILYLSFYATFGLYHLLPQATAFALMAMVTLMAGALALRYDAMAIAALGMLGGYATPILLSTGQDAPWTFFSYLLLIDVGAVALAHPRRWRPLDLMAFVATVILYMAWFSEWFKPEKQIVATAAPLAFYALFAFVEWSWIFYAAEVLAGLALVAIWPQATPFLVLSLVVGAAGLAIGGLTKRFLAAWFSFATFWGAYAFWISANGQPKEIQTAFLLLTIAFVMYLAWVPVQSLVRRLEIQSQDLIVLGLNGAIYFAASYVLLQTQYKAWMGLFAAAVAGVHLIVGTQLWKAHTAAGRDTRPVLLALGIALGFLTLAVPIQFTGFSITISWALEGAALIWISRRANESRILFGAAAVYVLVFLRLYSYDSFLAEAHRALLLNGRFLTFVISAVSFWLGAWWLKTTLRLPAAAGYVAGHLILLSACLFELNDWILTSVSIENRISVTAIGVSILLALYAVVLIGIGVAARSVLDRILGLGLIGLVVVKLYLFDVWAAGRVFRMAAFVALGILLLLTSYLYSRFRPTIESWWKDEQAHS